LKQLLLILKCPHGYTPCSLQQTGRKKLNKLEVTGTSSYSPLSLIYIVYREVKKNNAKMTRFLPVLDSRYVQVFVSIINSDCSVQHQVDVLLEKILDWDFNVFEVAELTNGRPLFFTGSIHKT
jgi:hypothetical protein